MTYARWIERLLLALLIGAAPAALAAAETTDPTYASLNRDFGHLKGNYVGTIKWPVSRQIEECLTVPDDNKTALADGNTLVSGCRRHDCEEKAAVITGHDGKELAAGLINFHCTRSSVNCDDAPHLSIFVKRKNLGPALVSELQAWAKTAANATISETVVVP
ncbi:MAG: hypothetical protein ABSD74_20790 [Rhizomicrobium sp.]|jgi:hypothetical protein